MPTRSRALSPHHRELLRARATWMRYAPTASEQLLWHHLRGKQLGVQFRRQVPLGRHIVDFYGSSVGLIVE
jgi:very-short-patch-repair endonuclease